jgi:hypothetical protein
MSLLHYSQLIVDEECKWLSSFDDVFKMAAGDVTEMTPSLMNTKRCKMAAVTS